MGDFVMKAFTLIEVAIVFGIFALISVIGLPVGIDAYRNYLLTSETRNILSILRRAQSLSFSNSYEKSYGMAVEPQNFVLFQGNSFDDRNQAFDEDYPRETSVTISGFSEIIFSRFSGRPNATTSIVLSNQLRSQSMDINEEGVINW